MEILHVSAECYPMAKAGGLADVVGALPKYQQSLGHIAKVVVPMHRTKFLYNNEWTVEHKGHFSMRDKRYDFTIIRETTGKLGFDLYCVDIYGLLDRERIYGYDDDTERFIAFQIAVLQWVAQWEHQPDIVHVHDYHSGLIPFMMKHCFAFRPISTIKTILTIHNAQYQGWMNWTEAQWLPAWDTWRWGLLEWNNSVNPLACAIKCADRVTTVSPGYMEEIKSNANGLEHLFYLEGAKCSGIINGIDYAVWNPATDTYILDNFSIKDVEEGKQINKNKLCDDFGFDSSLPLFVFIGRLVGEKAADLLPESIYRAFEQMPGQFSFLILGSGEPEVEAALVQMQNYYVGYYNSQISYNEKLSHQMYAGADFLLMPSRVEPCGLNQLYAMRYGTVPVVRRTGGLKDTVIDIGEKDGYGICFNQASVSDIVQGMERAVGLYQDQSTFNKVRKKMMKVETSWEKSAAQYIDLYLSI
jgi:starch synthase